MHGKKHQLSKTLFIRGLQCPKSLYLQKFRPELKEEVTPEKQRLFDSGSNVGILAQQLFPGGVNVPYEGLSYTQQIEKTQSLIQQGVDTIYEAAFSYQGVFVKCDILHLGSDGWAIYEVKSSAKAEEYHFNDVSVQYYVVSGTGLPVAKTFLVHINKNYVRHGEIEVDKLFAKVDVTDIAMEKRDFIKEELEKQLNMLDGDEPVIDIGAHCDNPFSCDFKSHCWSHIPSPSVFDYRGTGKPNSFQLYQKGIIRLEDVPPDMLGRRTKIQHEGMLYQKNHINVAALNKFLESFWHPLCFMDFETTFMVPVPMYDGIRPYQQVPFQFSVHVQQKPGGKLEHYEYLSDGVKNPQSEFIDRLLAVIPRDACIVTWNQGFEISRLREIATAFPDKRDIINHIINNIRDLMKPFQSMTVYNWQFNGSYSIKAVLPALVPELSYDDLEINNGGTASSAWVCLVQTNDAGEKETIRKQLLQYCHMDTLAMVRILEKMKEMAI
jgi:hypothetical protein